ncbi:MAG: ATP-binding cassette domain-containing protein [Magnetococcales bacterium]|nr:ATP-binding cassette domain-containing protein [Magnetococcales bacterium]
MKQLTVQSLNTPLLGPLNLSLSTHERCCLTGPSGSGKSLLLRSLADLDPHQGTVLLDGVDQNDIPPPLWRRQVAYLPAQAHWWRDRVGDHFPDGTLSPTLLSALGLAEKAADWQVDRLSSGERQRLALIRILANQPVVLLLDEPTANLDPDSGRLVEQVILDYVERHEAAALWVSHDMEQAQRIGHRRLHLVKGRLQEDNKMPSQESSPDNKEGSA